MDVFATLDRILRAFRWSLFQVYLLETLAVGAFLVVLLTGAGVAMCAIFPETEVVRLVVAALTACVLMACLAHVVLTAIRLFRDEVGVVIRLLQVFPEVGPGLESVVRLRPYLNRPEPPPFSEALLAAEATRSIRTLEKIPPRPPADLARTRWAVAATAALVALLTWFAFARPAEVAKGVRKLFGIEAMPAWIKIPEEKIDLLVRDLKMRWLVPRADGTMLKLDVGPAADIFAPPGLGVEVEGSLLIPAKQAKVVITSTLGTSEVPLSLFGTEKILFGLKEVKEGFWHVEALSTSGVRVREKSMRRIVVMPSDPLTISVEPSGTVILGVGSEATVTYRVESRVGIAKVEAVLRFPFSPSRPPVRVTLKAPERRELVAEGQMRFTWPSEPEAIGGRVDLEIEAYQWAAVSSESPSRSRRVRFVLDDEMSVRFAEIEEAEDLLEDVLASLAKVTKASAQTSKPPSGSPQQWDAVLEQARQALASQDPSALEKAALLLGEAVHRRWTMFMGYCLGQLERVASLWQKGADRSNEFPFAWVRQTLVMLGAVEQWRLQKADPLTTAHVLASRRIAALTRARDIIVAALEAPRSSASPMNEAMNRSVSAIREVLEVYKATLTQAERTGVGFTAVSPKVLEGLWRVEEAQRKVHGRTAPDRSRVETMFGASKRD